MSGPSAAYSFNGLCAYRARPTQYLPSVERSGNSSVARELF